jgi:hypothetical protein
MNRRKRTALTLACVTTIGIAACTIQPQQSSPINAPARVASVASPSGTSTEPRSLVLAEPISPAAEQLFQIIDSLDVEHHWPAGEHIFWESGVPDGRPELRLGKHTHCSAFAASAAKRVGIYLLRPPQHSELLLANAQYDWLLAHGPAFGWTWIAGEIEAQQLANEGQLVLAAYRNHDNDKPGHIAIVRPSDKGTSVIREEGPQITQAGATNHRSIPLSEGFGRRRREAAYYAHTVDATALKSSIPQH